MRVLHAMTSVIDSPPDTELPVAVVSEQLSGQGAEVRGQGSDKADIRGNVSLAAGVTGYFGTGRMGTIPIYPGPGGRIFGNHSD